MCHSVYCRRGEPIVCLWSLCVSEPLLWLVIVVLQHFFEQGLLGFNAAVGRFTCFRLRSQSRYELDRYKSAVTNVIVYRWDTTKMRHINFKLNEQVRENKTKEWLLLTTDRYHLSLDIILGSKLTFSTNLFHHS